MVCTDKQSETCVSNRQNWYPNSHQHFHTHTPAIPVWDEVEQQAEYKYLLCLIDLQISRQNNKMMTTNDVHNLKLQGNTENLLIYP